MLDVVDMSEGYWIYSYSGIIRIIRSFIIRLLGGCTLFSFA